MEMSLQENSQTTWWFNKPTTMDPNLTLHTHHQNVDTVSPDDCEFRHVSPYDREPMFEKPLTPSDVGKLNRLVIPKQHAEKHFPLGGGGDALLGFEDESGKSWRFRYSYWNSSQSYVLTKGWSRYVKEKRLDAGDVVCFQRHRAEPERIFIGWRRRGAPMAASGDVCYNAQGYYQAQDSRGQGAPAAAREGAEAVAESSNSPRLVRLFGVNLECQRGNNPTTQTTSSESSLLSVQQQQQGYGYYLDYSTNQPLPPPTHSYHLEMNFPQGVNQMGNGLI